MSLKLVLVLKEKHDTEWRLDKIRKTQTTTIIHVSKTKKIMFTESIHSPEFQTRVDIIWNANL